MKNKIYIITGTRKGLGKRLAEYVFDKYINSSLELSESINENISYWK